MDKQLKYASITGVDKTSDFLARFVMQQRADRFLRALAEYGAEKATAYFKFPYPGTNDVTQAKAQKVGDTEWTVSASGQNITFIEFGSGVVYPSGIFAKLMGFGSRTWSQSTNGKNAITKRGYWFYKGSIGDGSYAHPSDTHNGWNITSGSPGANAMPYAARDMRDYIESAFEQAFLT